MENGGRRIRCNHVLSRLYKGLDTVRFTKIERLQWAAHVERITEGGVSKKAIKGRPVNSEGKEDREHDSWILWERRCSE